MVTRNWRALVFAAGVACALSAQAAKAADGEIPILGLDDAGNPVEVKLTAQEYAERLQASMLTVQDSTAAALASRAPTPGWMLRTAIVGVGVGVEVGVGPIWKIKAIPRFRLAFSNSKDPVLP